MGQCAAIMNLAGKKLWIFKLPIKFDFLPSVPDDVNINLSKAYWSRDAPPTV
jgi:hypothetical protein